MGNLRINGWGRKDGKHHWIYDEICEQKGG